jgi:hypothetical protein
MTVSFFAGPVEKTSFTFNTASAAAESPISFSITPRLVAAKTLNRSFSYRGPPPLDRRIDRIKNRIIRI